jgi:2,3-dihydroxy-p-cumate/2,3-dihydroxybenzoate 3,4-dioxygenase
MLPFRYRKPGYIALNVTDLARSIAFYRDLVGLQLEQQDAQTAFFRCSQDHHNLVLYQSQVAGIKRMAFEMESEADLEQAARYIDQQGWVRQEVAAAETQALQQGRSFRFGIPASSLTFEFYAHMHSGRGDYLPSVSKIERLGHVVIRCAQRDAVLKTLTEQLNFRVSDHFGDQVSFLRCFPNPLHHTFGVSRGDTDGLHHLNFMVTDVDDVGCAMNRMRKAGVEVVYGPGRHAISNSIFIYFLDPDGLTVEYSFGMEEFPETDPRAARQLPLRPEILDSWGGAPAPQFGKNGVMEPAAF